ncbi:response regulator transcription factor [Deinococcus metallilatus]|uniref:DNA-binding NarL/FixJ family response regulator n=2 Tax=Deinococcus TaxID=1298 RepID=A0AAJ5F2I7_9DEIO|nr:response regulator transcription factor [Deinococcus metallilatus]MBB5296072.1 DNA-binding NarL/FixJ family response regulator [Deinococcus metallilatus]QBY08120.1 response regulator transcription factor [Deinococcus metallilatus]RXJ11853.1 response regulator transcription factor [Deinococcus metallilatus]TLK25916.1 response regulator transcription factor [Deinococcus metallilatus]GMA14391.1 DNA-binding response regulator [Deinococcus metallilatus]
MKLVIADDHPLFRMGLKYALLHQGFDVVAEAADGLQALEACRALQPDAALLDVKMPGLTGVEVCERLRLTHPQVVSVLITTFTEPAIVQAARAAGARGYVSKETDPESLARQLRDIVAHPEIDRLPQVDVPRLTPRESEVLPLLAQGFSNKEIAKNLGVSPDTVKDHLARLYAKLDAGDRTEAVSRARSIGLLH